MRKYRANYDTGHDYGSFEFYSCYRAGSKGNLEDAKREARKKFSKSMYNSMIVNSIDLIKEN